MITVKCIPLQFVLVLLIITFTLLHAGPLKIRKTDRQSHSSRNRKWSHNHREDARKVLKILREKSPSQPCIPDFVVDHNPLRIPEAIPQMICPKGTEDRCIEIKLPMTVAFYSSSKIHRKLVHKAIYVATGCYELQPIHGIPSIHRKREHKKFNRKIEGTIRNSKEPGDRLYSSNSPLTSSANISNKKRKHRSKLNKQMNRTRGKGRGESRPSGKKSQKSPKNFHSRKQQSGGSASSSSSVNRS